MKTRTDQCIYLILTSSILVIMFCFIISCSTKERHLVKETRIFENYMQKEFNVTLASQKRRYFLVPSSACLGCKKSVLDYFLEIKNKPNDFLIITSNQVEQSGDISIQNNMLIDKGNKIDRLDLSAENTTLIVWETNKIQSIITVTPENIDSITANNR